jgi:hypothetical protein
VWLEIGTTLPIILNSAAREIFSFWNSKSKKIQADPKDHFRSTLDDHRPWRGWWMVDGAMIMRIIRFYTIVQINPSID